MKTLRFLKGNIVRRQTLMIAIAALVLLLCVQIATQKVYRDTLEAQVTQIEQSSLRIQSSSLHASIKPYLDYLYSIATDTTILQSAKPTDGIVSVKDQILIRDTFKNIILNVKNALGLGLIYGDGSSVYYEKTDILEDFWKPNNAPTRAGLFADAIASRVPISLIDARKGRAKQRVYVAVPCIGSYLSRNDTYAVAVIVMDLTFLESDFVGMDTDTSSHYLLDAQGRVLMCADASLIGETLTSPDFGKAGERLDMNSRVNTV